MSDKVDKSIERKMFYHQAEAPPDSCPQCGQALVKDFGPYQITTRSGRRLTDEFVMSGDFGYLCGGCATAVIHVPFLTTMLYGVPMKPGWKAGPEYAVLGLVNLDAVPPEQAHLPMNEWDPYPLVLFHLAEPSPPKSPTRRKRPRKPKRRQ
jgi:hypothetical protein